MGNFGVSIERNITNEQVLPMVGELKTVRLATEVHYLFKDEKFILMFKRVPSAETEADTVMRSPFSWSVQPVPVSTEVECVT